MKKPAFSMLVVCCCLSVAGAALDVTRQTDDLAKKYSADDVLGGLDGWNSTGLIGGATGEDFFKNGDGNLQYTTLIIAGGVWEQQEAAGSYFVDNVGANTSYTLEASIKIAAPAGGVHTTYIWTENAASQGLVFSIYDTGTSLSGDPDTDNTDMFHIFRVAFDAADDLFYVWRDSQLLGTTSASNPGGGQRLIFGDGSSSIISGTVQYQYIAVDATGASEPSADPYCGQAGTVYLPGDLNRDCYVNLEDLEILALEWLKCTDILLADCQDNL